MVRLLSNCTVMGADEVNRSSRRSVVWLRFKVEGLVLLLDEVVSRRPGKVRPNTLLGVPGGLEASDERLATGSDVGFEVLVGSPTEDDGAETSGMNTATETVVDGAERGAGAELLAVLGGGEGKGVGVGESEGPGNAEGPGSAESPGGGAGGVTTSGTSFRPTVRV